MAGGANIAPSPVSSMSRESIGVTWVARLSPNQGDRGSRQDLGWPGSVADVDAERTRSNHRVSRAVTATRARVLSVGMAGVEQATS